MQNVGFLTQWLIIFLSILFQVKTGLKNSKQLRHISPHNLQIDCCENVHEDKNAKCWFTVIWCIKLKLLLFEPRCVENRSSGFPTRSDTNRAVQLLNMARSLKFWIEKVEGLYYPCSENKGADQLRGYHEADLRLCFRICKSRFSHNEAHLYLYYVRNLSNCKIGHT